MQNVAWLWWKWVYRIQRPSKTTLSRPKFVPKIAVAIPLFGSCGTHKFRLTLGSIASAAVAVLHGTGAPAYLLDLPVDCNLGILGLGKA
jgi:hypothetical protein